MTNLDSVFKSRDIHYFAKKICIVKCQGPAPAGSKDTLRMDGVGERDDTGLIMDWNLMVRG